MTEHGEIILMAPVSDSVMEVVRAVTDGEDFSFDPLPVPKGVSDLHWELAVIDAQRRFFFTQTDTVISLTDPRKPQQDASLRFIPRLIMAAMQLHEQSGYGKIVKELPVDILQEYQ